MELFKLFGTIAIENSDANEQIDDTTDKAKESQSSITESLKKIGAAVATYFAIDKIKEFGLGCINAAADANAASSQFAQVFGDLERKASKSLSNIADSAGINENRMKGSFTQIAAFAKTTGMETDDALSLTERAMVAVADSAAFYDRSLEDTTESLQSFLKGNYENDAALGLSCTETTRNAAANALYGKSFNDLSESQKQLTLLQMVEDANKASGALGQAARESDTWTNQIGNLQQAWTDFQAVIGVPLLEAIIPVVKGITFGITSLTNYLKSGSLTVETFTNKITGMFSIDFISSIQEWGFYLKDVIVIFADNTIDMFSSKIEGVTQLFTNFGNVLQPIVEAILINLVQQFDSLLVTWNDGILPVLSFVIDVLTQLGNTILTAVSPAIQSICAKFNELGQWVNAAYQNYILPMFTAFVSMLQDLWAENQDKLQLIGDAFQAAFEFIQSLVSTFVEIFKNYIYPFFEWLHNTVTSNMDNIKAVFQSVFDIIGGIAKFFIALFKGDWSGMWSAVKSILSSAFDYVKNVFNLIKSIFSSVGSSLKSIISNVFGNIKSTISSGLNAAKNTVSNVLNSIKSKFSSIMNSAKTIVSGAINKIKGFFKFSWSLPKLKMPHPTITGKFSLNPPSVPKFSISWYKKAMNEPYMFTEPTLFDVNPATGHARGAGEAGDELMIGKETMLNMIRAAVSAENTSVVQKLEILISILSKYFPEIIESMKREIVLDSGALVGELAPAMDDELGKISDHKGRGN